MLVAMPWKPTFDHEKLDVYRAAIEFVVWSGALLDGPLAGRGLSAVKQLDRASTSVPLNIAEGNGKRSRRDRCRYLDSARGSAYECAAALDVLVARRALEPEAVASGKTVLVRIVEMLGRLISSLEAKDAQERFENENENEKENENENEKENEGSLSRMRSSPPPHK
jgi:four helix bundle protein